MKTPADIKLKSELMGMAAKAGPLLKNLNEAMALGGQVEIPHTRPETLFLFLQTGLYGGPCDKIDVLLTRAGAAFTIDGEVVGWPVKKTELKPGQRPIDILRSVDYMPYVSRFCSDWPDGLSVLKKQIEGYEDEFYTGIENLVGAG